MKILFRTILVLALSAAALHAQSYGVSSFITGTTNNVAAGATNTYTQTGTKFDQDEQIGLLVSYKMPVAGNSNVTVRLAKSLNGTTWEVTPSLVVVATTTNYITNLTIGAVGYIRVSTVENVHPVALTNVTVSYSKKPSIRGN